jgi:hypothetical protein
MMSAGREAERPLELKTDTEPAQRERMMKLRWDRLPWMLLGMLIGFANGWIWGAAWGDRFVRGWAVESGHAEYYLDEDNERQWRWLPTTGVNE